MFAILPSPQSFFGYIAFITSLIGLLPQVYKAYLTKSTIDISLGMLINYLVCSLAWIAYSYYEQTFIVLLSNLVGLVVCLISIMQKYYYDKR